jgi:NADH-quinone oxidoreductase subunit D
MKLETIIQDPFKTEEYMINMGPQHPATHGVLRLVLTIDGEIIKKGRTRFGIYTSFYRKNV